MTVYRDLPSNFEARSFQICEFASFVLLYFSFALSLNFIALIDFAIVKAWKGDKTGNLIFKGTARNFNPAMAMAGKTTIAEVEELVEPGELNPNEIHTPGIFIQRIFKGQNYEKRIEQRTVRKQL